MSTGNIRWTSGADTECRPYLYSKRTLILRRLYGSRTNPGSVVNILVCQRGRLRIRPSLRSRRAPFGIVMHSTFFFYCLPREVAGSLYGSPREVDLVFKTKLYILIIYLFLKVLYHKMSIAIISIVSIYFNELSC